MGMKKKEERRWVEGGGGGVKIGMGNVEYTLFVSFFSTTDTLLSGGSRLLDTHTRIFVSFSRRSLHTHGEVQNKA